jgi:NADH-quinone oxidoreductase subunit F
MNMNALRVRAERDWQAVISPSIPRIFVGTATCGEASGAGAIIDAVNDSLCQHGIDAFVEKTGCLGMCYCEPLVDIIKPGNPRISYGNMTPESVAGLITDYLVSNDPRPDLAIGAWGADWCGIPDLFSLPFMKNQVRIALRNTGVINPESIFHYIARGGYLGLETALKMDPGDVISLVEKSGLRGRGGAGFPTGIKWKFCRRAEKSPKYLICNADEGDPGAFMDRALLESDPHSVLEGMLIGAWAIGCSQGFIYIRAEYPLAIRRLNTAISQMKHHGLLGNNILGTGFSFDIDIREGAGAFVCGEETALLASLEGKRGTPYPRPPFPAEAGLWGKPTNINNVETFANVPVILEKGADWYSGFGTEKSRGTKTFALAGNVNHTGLIEVPMGMTLRDIVFGIGGGITEGKKLKAIQTGGPAGGCLPESKLDLPVDYESLAQAGSIMGSGGMIVLDEDDSMLQTARYFMTFIQSESCGKCTPCRAGTRQMLSILENLLKGRGRPQDIEMLERLGASVKKGSLCGLGQAAPNPVLTTIRYFREEYEQGIHPRYHARHHHKHTVTGE